MTHTHIFTSAALNYLPKVRILFNSIREHHPEIKLHLALADIPDAPLDISDEPFDSVITIESLNIPDWRGWAFCHDIVEFSTAIKPFALKSLLGRPDCNKALYFDPDMVLFSRIDDILNALNDSSILLTPHQTVPEDSLEAVIDNEICSLRHGIYNLGFIGVCANDEGLRFANWWSSRIYYFCRADTGKGLFTDQRWIDFVPVFFDEVGIIKSSRHNVATWNLTTRDLSGDGVAGYKVDGRPLGFYHFTGFDSGAHGVMLLKNAAGNQSAKGLYRWYERRLKRDKGTDQLWYFSRFSSGETVTPAQRLVYRERKDLQNAFPDPFDCSNTNCFLTWWNTQGRKEFPRLFDPDRTDEAMDELSQPLTPGFGATQLPRKWDQVFRHLATAVVNKKHRELLARKAVSALKSDRLSGLLRKTRNWS